MENHMKAVMKTNPGPGIEIRAIPCPTLPKNYPDGEVIVEVGACGICGTDVGIYRWHPWESRSVKIPRVLGHEISGTVVEIGKNCGDWKVGDRVVSDTDMGCGKCFFCRIGRVNICENRKSLGLQLDGGMAKYVATRANNLFLLPAHLSFEVGAAMEPLGVAMNAYLKSGFKPGDKVLILGTGSIGLATLMLLKTAGASEVFITGLKVDQWRFEKAKELGADAVFNVDEEDPTDQLMSRTHGRGVDIVFVCAGGRENLFQASRWVRKAGTVMVIGLSHGGVDFDSNLLVEKELVFKGAYRRTPETWDRILELVGKGKIPLKELVTHSVPLEEVEAGFHLIEKGEALKVVVTP